MKVSTGQEGGGLQFHRDEVLALGTLLDLTLFASSSGCPSVSFITYFIINR